MKRNFLVILFALTANFSFAQKFMSGLGITGFDNQITRGNTSSNAKSVGGVGIVYYPRVNFIETDKYSVSVGIPLYLGIGMNLASHTVIDQYGYPDRVENSTMGYILNAPVLVSFNFGRGAVEKKKKDKKDAIGFFVAGGFGYNGSYLIYDDVDNYYGDGTSTLKADHSFGPAASAGLRLGVGRRHRNIELAASFMQGITGGRAKVIGGRVLFNF